MNWLSSHPVKSATRAKHAPTGRSTATTKPVLIKLKRLIFFKSSQVAQCAAIHEAKSDNNNLVPVTLR